MLSRNRVKQTFFRRSLLVMVPIAALNPSVSHSSATPEEHGKRIYRLSWLDTTKWMSPDSITGKTSSATITLNKHVAGYVTAYLKKETAFLEKMKRKSGQYFGTIEKVFDQYNLPVQLKYLAIVESELRSNATSRVGAKGLWQLMPVTAKELGLKITAKRDERTHTYSSTVAAARYLRYLYAEFGDWLLALAAYNSGPGTVYKAMKKAGSKHFWTLQKFLPAESRGHVKRFIAIHYFFEGEGSITTQTKAEAKASQEKICEAEEASLVTGH